MSPEDARAGDERQFRERNLQGTYIDLGTIVSQETSARGGEAASSARNLP